MSTITFVTAQYNLLLCEGVRHLVESERQEAFTVSAIAAATDLTNGATLADLATANKVNLAVCEELDMTKPSTLYTSPASVTYHAVTGTILSLPVGEGDAPIPTSVQTLVVKALNKAKISAKAVKAAIKSSATQQDAVDRLTKGIEKALKAQADAPQGGGSGEGDGEGESFGAGSTDDPTQTVETLLSRVVALVESGAVLSDAARAMVTSLTDAPALVAVA